MVLPLNMVQVQVLLVCELMIQRSDLRPKLQNVQCNHQTQKPLFPMNTQRTFKEEINW
jgi:hypothetical protein